jgi:hypothetical protein
LQLRGERTLLRDYLYVDEKRLNSYVNQIGSPVTYDKVPVWKVIFGMTGPQVEGEQRRDGRQRTPEEKIKLLTDHLRRKKELEDGRVADQSYYGQNRALFRLERCKAIRLELARVKRGGHEDPQFLLWMSEMLPAHASEMASRLFLLQDDGRSDDSEAYGGKSAFSSLVALYEEGISLSLANDKDYRFARTTKIGQDLSRKRRQKTSSSLDRVLKHEDVDPESVASAAEKVLDDDPGLVNPKDEELKKEFALNPAGVLQRLGAKASSWQDIEALYRVRVIHVERGVTPIIVTFAYPVFIAR